MYIYIYIKIYVYVYVYVYHIIPHSPFCIPLDIDTDVHIHIRYLLNILQPPFWLNSHSPTQNVVPLWDSSPNPDHWRRKEFGLCPSSRFYSTSALCLILSNKISWNASFLGDIPMKSSQIPIKCKMLIHSVQFDAPFFESLEPKMLKPSRNDKDCNAWSSEDSLLQSIRRCKRYLILIGDVDICIYICVCICISC